MQMKAVNYVGAKRVAYLPSHIRLDIRIINHSRFRSFSPFTHQVKSTFHDTGNPRSNAEGEYAWAAGGRVGGVVGGYSFIVDDTKIIQTGPLNERSWHAGSPRGNESFGTELAYGGNVVWNTALENVCAQHASVLEMQGLEPDDAVLHQWWTQKWCAAQILNRGLWPLVLQKIRYYWQLCRDARNAAAGKPVPTPPPTEWLYPAQRPVTFQDGTAWDGAKNATIAGTKYYAQKGKVKLTVNLRRRQDATTQSPDVGPVLASGTEIDVLGWEAGEMVSGVSEWWITPGGTRFWAGGIDAKPVQVPDYGDNPAHVPGMQIVNGRIYYPLHDDETGDQGRMIEVKRPGNLRKWADTSSAIVGTVKPGEEKLMRYWTRGEKVPLYQGGPMEPIWYSEELHSGARMWSGLSDERPD